jgi:pseudouridine synthase
MRSSGQRQEERESGVRLNKFIAAAGITSRRGAEALILQGAVLVNGQPVRSLATLVDPARDRVRVHGKLIKQLERKVSLVLNKPKGYICTRRDELDRPTVLDLVPSKPRLFPVGRLDYDAEGVLILTNDGDLAHSLLHPRHGVPRIYLVKVRGEPSAAELLRLATGLPLADGWRVRAEVSVEARRAKHVWLRMKLHEGRHGQIKEMCRRIGHPVLKLKRISFGPFTAVGLEPGAWRRISEGELTKLRWSDRNAEAPRA